MMDENEKKRQECVSDVERLIRCYEKEIDHTGFFISKATTEAYRRYLLSSQEQLEQLLDMLQRG